jgi:glutamate--cysteine ligase
MLELARQCLDLADAGLKRRKRLDGEGRDETRYLAPLKEFVARGITPADELLAKYNGPWEKSVEPVFSEYAY